MKFLKKREALFFLDGIKNPKGEIEFHVFCQFVSIFQHVVPLFLHVLTMGALGNEKRLGLAIGEKSNSLAVSSASELSFEEFFDQNYKNLHFDVQSMIPSVINEDLRFPLNFLASF